MSQESHTRVCSVRYPTQRKSTWDVEKCYFKLRGIDSLRLRMETSGHFITHLGIDLTGLGYLTIPFLISLTPQMHIQCLRVLLRMAART